MLLETSLIETQRRIPPGNAILEQTPQGVVVSAQVDRLERLARSLMLLECPFVIRRRPELRAALRQLAAEAAAMAQREEQPM